MQINLQKTMRWEVREGEDLFVFTVSQTNLNRVSITATAGGVVYSGSVACDGSEALDILKGVSVDKLCHVLDPFGVAYQHIEADTIKEVLQQRAEILKLDRGDAILNASQFSTMSVLHTQCHELMCELCGFNWTVELAPELLGKSQRFKTVQRLATILQSLVG